MPGEAVGNVAGEVPGGGGGRASGLKWPVGPGGFRPSGVPTPTWAAPRVFASVSAHG